MWLIIAAKVVDLPLPVGPVNRTKPLSKKASLLIIGGIFNSSDVKITEGIILKEAANPLIWLKKLTLNHPKFFNKSSQNNNKIVNYEVFLKKSLKKFIEYKR